MSKVEYSDTYVRETDSRIRHREFLLQGIEELTLLHDTFMKVALKDVEACQHVIRILMDDPTIEIVEVRSQYRMEKGKEYNEMPEVYVIYISEADIWETRVTESPVERHLKGQIEEYNDGQYTIYINAAIDDGSPKAALMQYFKTCDPDDMSQGALSRRVHYLKREKGGIGEMCEYSERIFNGGKEEGLREGCEKMIRLMREQGVDEAIIEKIMASAAEQEPVKV